MDRIQDLVFIFQIFNRPKIANHRQHLHAFYHPSLDLPFEAEANTSSSELNATARISDRWPCISMLACLEGSKVGSAFLSAGNGAL